MNTPDKNNAGGQAEESKNEASQSTEKAETVHTINPFTGTEVDITPEDLEGIEKFKEAQTERD